MKAIKDNRVYTITEADVDRYYKDGFDIFDDSGRVIKYGIGKSVSYETFAKLEAAYRLLLEENADLTSKCSELEAELAQYKTKKTRKKDAPEEQE